MLSKSKNETPRQAFDKAEAEGDSVSNLNIISAIELKSGGRIKAALDVADAPPAYVIAVDPEFEKADDLLSDLDMTPALEAESDAEIMRALDPSDDDTAPAPVAPAASKPIKKPAPPPSAMADISDDEIGRALADDADLDLESGAEIIVDIDLDLDLDLEADPRDDVATPDALAPAPDPVAAPEAGIASTVNADLPAEPVGELDPSDEAAIEAAIEIAGAVADSYSEVEAKRVKKAALVRLADSYRDRQLRSKANRKAELEAFDKSEEHIRRIKRGWSPLSDRELAATSRGECDRARKTRNKSDSRAKAASLAPPAPAMLPVVITPGAINDRLARLREWVALPGDRQRHHRGRETDIMRSWVAYQAHVGLHGREPNRSQLAGAFTARFGQPMTRQMARKRLELLGTLMAVGGPLR